MWDLFCPYERKANLCAKKYQSIFFRLLSHRGEDFLLAIEDSRNYT
jgi:hypothetical protein